MAQISNTNLTHIVDKMARHALEANGTALATAITTGGVYAATALTGGLAIANTDVLSSMQTLALGFNSDADQSDDFIPPATVLNAAPPLLNQFNYSFWISMRQALDKHMARYSANAMLPGDLSPLDAALRVINKTTLLRVHSAFAQYFGGISPANTFTGTPLTLATITVTGASAGTLTHVTTAALAGVGPGQIVCLNTATEGGASAVLTVTCIQNGVATNVAFTTGAGTLNYLTAASDTTKTYTDATILVSVASATNADTYSICLLPDRLINAA